MQEASVHAKAVSQEKGDHIPWGWVANHSRRTGSRGNACGVRLGWDLQLSDPSWGRASLLSKLCPVRQSDRVRSSGNSVLVLRLPVAESTGEGGPIFIEANQRLQQVLEARSDILIVS